MVTKWIETKPIRKLIICEILDGNVWNTHELTTLFPSSVIPSYIEFTHEIE